MDKISELKSDFIYFFLYHLVIFPMALERR